MTSISDVAQVPARGELFVHPNPAEVLLDAAKFEAFYQTIVKETDTLVPDITTQRGRDAIKAVAFKVTKTKTFLDEFGKKLNEDRRKEIGIVDAARRTMRDKLETLKETVRKPLTDWEEAEEERAQTINATMAYFRGIAPEVAAKGTIEAYEAAIDETRQTLIDPEVFEEETPFAENARTIALADLQKGLAAAVRAEADRAELERLRAEAETRQQADAERERQEASRIAEDTRLAREEEEQRAREIAAGLAAERAAQAKADLERQAADARHQEELERARAETAQLEKAMRDKADADKRIAEEAEARRKDQKHRTDVRTDAASAIATVGQIGIGRADKIVMAIIAGEIPNVSITW